MCLSINSIRITAFQYLFLAFLELWSSASVIDSLNQASFYDTSVREWQVYLSLWYQRTMNSSFSDEFWA